MHQPKSSKETKHKRKHEHEYEISIICYWFSAEHGICFVSLLLMNELQFHSCALNNWRCNTSLPID